MYLELQGMQRRLAIRLSLSSRCGTSSEKLLCAENTRNRVELTPAFIEIHRVTAQDRSRRGLGSAAPGPKCAGICRANTREQAADVRIACRAFHELYGQSQATRAEYS